MIEAEIEQFRKKTSTGFKFLFIGYLFTTKIEDHMELFKSQHIFVKKSHENLDDKLSAGLVSQTLSTKQIYDLSPYCCEV